MEIIKNDVENTVIISLGPATDLAKMIEKEPEIMEKVRVISMFGSVEKGYGDKVDIDAEYNVRADTSASKKMVSSLKNLTIIPVDSCSIFKVDGEEYQKMIATNNKTTKTVLEDYEKWKDILNAKGLEDCTSILYDVIPVYALLDGNELNYKKYKLIVDDDGYTRIDKNGNGILCAISWKSMEIFTKEFVSQMTK